MGIDLVWFGVLVAMTLQTSFLTPPFGYALFYLRSVAPRNDYTDGTTGRRIGKVTTGQIYKGSLAFVMLQVVMIAILMIFPNLVTSGLDRGVAIDVDSVKLQLDTTGQGSSTDGRGYGPSQW